MKKKTVIIIIIAIITTSNKIKMYDILMNKSIFARSLKQYNFFEEFFFRI